MPRVYSPDLGEDIAVAEGHIRERHPGTYEDTLEALRGGGNSRWECNDGTTYLVEEVGSNRFRLMVISRRIIKGTRFLVTAYVLDRAGLERTLRERDCEDGRGRRK